MNDDDDSSSDGIFSDAVSEHRKIPTDNHNAEFFEFIRIMWYHVVTEMVGSEPGDEQVHRYELRRRMEHKSTSASRREVVFEESSDEDPLISIVRARNAPRRSHRIKARYLQQVDIEEDGTFRIPTPRRVVRKSPRNHRDISYNEHDMFSAEFSDIENEHNHVSNTGEQSHGSKNSGSNFAIRDSHAKPDIVSPLCQPLKIAGFDDYIRKLKEMIVFPLLYPEVFDKLGISLPRGVLFYGPPGTGKTLLARLLADSCSIPGSDRKVSFFMKNGSDCLSKWIGEAEKNLRLLFKKAREQQPSIIFFDEVDGLAPERTEKQEQSHISLVATLLALMDGLDDRGNVVVIGATNRINSLDAALRRPGRFDREFYFDLPNEQTRRDILRLHTSKWNPALAEDVLYTFAKETINFSGADLKALCVEAALKAMRRACPAAYDLTGIPPNPEDFLKSTTNLVITFEDFQSAYNEIVPGIKRKNNAIGPLTGPLYLLFSSIIHTTTEYLRSLIYYSHSSNIQFVEPIVSFIFEQKPACSGSHIKRLLSSIALSLPDIRLIIIDAHDILCRPTVESLRVFLRDSLTKASAIFAVCGLGDALEELPEDAQSVVRQFINDNFYQGSPYMLVLLEKYEFEWSALLNIDWNLSNRRLRLQDKDIKRFIFATLKPYDIPIDLVLDDLSISSITEMEIKLTKLRKDLDTLPSSQWTPTIKRFLQKEFIE